MADLSGYGQLFQMNRTEMKQIWNQMKNSNEEQTFFLRNESQTYNEHSYKRVAHVLTCDDEEDNYRRILIELTNCFSKN